jgi:hypothetical protein
MLGNGAHKEAMTLAAVAAPVAIGSGGRGGVERRERCRLGLDGVLGEVPMMMSRIRASESIDWPRTLT